MAIRLSAHSHSSWWSNHPPWWLDRPTNSHWPTHANGYWIYRVASPASRTTSGLTACTNSPIGRHANTSNGWQEHCSTTDRPSRYVHIEPVLWSHTKNSTSLVAHRSTRCGVHFKLAAPTLLPLARSNQPQTHLD